MHRLSAAMALIATCCVALPAGAAPAPDLTRLFQGRQGCVVLFDANAHKEMLRFNPKRCCEQIPACSTFKVPLAVMAFDAGAIDTAMRFTWDGQKHPIESWNQDQTPTTWLQNSTVWVSQQITAKMGLKAVQRYLWDFGYGNKDMSGGLTTAWLPSSGNATLKVSADEQIHFWDQLYAGKLKASASAQQAVRERLTLQTTPSGAVFSGKTGSGRILDSHGQPTGKDIGWFVGHIQRKDRGYLIAVNFTDEKTGLTQGPGGFVARQMAIDVLKAKGLF